MTELAVLFDTGEPDGLRPTWIGLLSRRRHSRRWCSATVISTMYGLMVSSGWGRNLPLLLHPDFWSRRRVVTPSGAWELPVPSRTGIEGAGFQIIEDRRPSFLLDGKMLVTGEIDRTTEFEKGFPIHQAWRTVTGAGSAHPRRPGAGAPRPR
jgi:hypothetical protein